MPSETRTYRRSELYEQVWAEPVREVAKRYGVSDVALAKTCRKLAVPLPGVGYWAKKRAGGRTRRTPLPPLPEGVAEEETVQRPDEPALSPETQMIVAELKSPEAAIVVEDSLTDPHELVAKAQRLLRRVDPIDWSVGEGCLDIAVSRQKLDRALRIFDSLIKALEKRGLPVEVTDASPRTHRLPVNFKQRANTTRVRIADEWLRIDMVESRSGELILRILDADYVPGRTSCKDGKRLRLEECLNTFVVALYVKAEALKQMHAEAEQTSLRYEEAERQRQEAKERAEEEARRVKDYHEMLARWRFARDIREFCAMAKQMVRDSECHLLRGGELHEQIVWGLAYADKIDPLRSVKEELAGHLRSRRTKAMLGALYTPPFPEG